MKSFSSKGEFEPDCSPSKSVLGIGLTRLTCLKPSALQAGDSDRSLTVRTLSQQDGAKQEKACYAEQTSMYVTRWHEPIISLKAVRAYFHRINSPKYTCENA